MSMIVFAASRCEPSVKKIGGVYLILYELDHELTSLLAAETQVSCDLLIARAAEFTEKRFDKEWKLPLDQRSRSIEYMGVSTRYSKIRFGIMTVIILASGNPVSYKDVSMAGWGGIIGNDVLEDTIYQFNKFLARKGIPKFLHCEKGFIVMRDITPEEIEKLSGKPKKTVA